MEKLVDGIKYEQLLFGNDVLGWRLICNYHNKNADITIPDNIDDLPVLRIGANSFALHSGLVSVKIPDSVEIINHDAFRGCRNLENVTVYQSDYPNNREILSVYSGAFDGCHKLKSFSCNKPCHLNGKSIFRDCYELANIGNNNKVFGSIYANCFRNCVCLESLHIIGDTCRLWTNCFYGCSNLNNVRFDCDWVSVPQSILLFLAKKNVACRAKCVLTELAYLGGNVEILEEGV